MAIYGGPKAIQLPKVYNNSGNAAKDKQLASYLNMPQKVMRNGVMIDIYDHNARMGIMKKRKR